MLMQRSLSAASRSTPIRHVSQNVHLRPHRTLARAVATQGTLLAPEQAVLADVQLPAANASVQGWMFEDARVWTTLSTINDSSKWGLVALMYTSLAWFHNDFAAWCVVGAIASSFVCQKLKRVLNQARPLHSGRSDPGMPSNHATSATFLSSYAALCALHFAPHDPAAHVLATTLVSAGMFVTWLRVAFEDHTWHQVGAGVLLGTASAIVWFELGAQIVLGLLVSWGPLGVVALSGMTAASSALLMGKTVRKWTHKTLPKLLVAR